MGHQQTKDLPSGAQWQRVMRLITDGASAAKVAELMFIAVKKHFSKMHLDRGVINSIQLLMQLPLAATSRDFQTQLDRLGIPVESTTDGFGVYLAFSECIENAMINQSGNTDLGALAHRSAVNCLAKILQEDNRGLFDQTIEDVQHILKQNSTSNRIAKIASMFFADLTFSLIDSYFSRMHSEVTGYGKRFRTLDERERFSEELKDHSNKVSKIFIEFTRDWHDKHVEEVGDVRSSDVKNYLYGAAHKLVKYIDAEGTIHV